MYQVKLTKVSYLYLCSQRNVLCSLHGPCMYRGSVDQPTYLPTYSMYTVQCIDHVCTRVQLREVCSAMYCAASMDHVRMYQGSVDRGVHLPTIFSAMSCAKWLVVVNPVLRCISVWFQNVLFNVLVIDA